jgi:hypothetical protein
VHIAHNCRIGEGTIIGDGAHLSAASARARKAQAAADHSPTGVLPVHHDAK